MQNKPAPESTAGREKVRKARTMRLLNTILAVLIVGVLVFVGLIVYSTFFQPKVPRSPEEQQYYLALDLVKKNPGNAYYYQLLARAEADLGRNEEAIDHLKKAIKLAPRRPMSHYYLALIYLKIGDEKNAIKEFREELKVTDQMNELVWYELAKIYWKNKKYEDAEKAFQFTLKRAPTMADVHIDLGKMYLEWGKPDKAKAEFLEAVRYEPDNEEAQAELLKLGIIPSGQGTPTTGTAGETTKTTK
jgi:tetratricopeptide (TPR) repeat protein